MSESSFPTSLDYSPDPLAISARSYIAKCVPESSSTGRPNDIVRIRIPSGRAGSYLNNSKSFLSFEVLNTSTCPAITASESEAVPPVRILQNSKLHMDGSAYAVIQTQEVYNSSNLLESIQNANVLYNMLVDLQTSMGSRLTGSKILGIGATNVNQAWNTYHGQTLAPKADGELLYSSFNFVQNSAELYRLFGPQHLVRECGCGGRKRSFAYHRADTNRRSSRAAVRGDRSWCRHQSLPRSRQPRLPIC